MKAHDFATRLFPKSSQDKRVIELTGQVESFKRSVSCIVQICNHPTLDALTILSNVEDIAQSVLRDNA